MFDKLIELISQFIDYIKFWEVINPYEKGILLRLGKFKRVLDNGFHFKRPFFDVVEKDIVVTQTLTIPSQTINTKDLKEITIKSVVKYSIADIKLFLTEVYDRVDAISDTTMVINKELIVKTNLDGIHLLDGEIAKKLRVQVKKWGIEIESVCLTDITKTNSFRLFNENILNG